MTSLTELAKQCGARVLTNGVEHRITFDEDQLTAFVERIREEEREKAEQDARRYRWLRAGNYPIAFARSVLNDIPNGIDAAIDAAMEASNG
jgi:hypothetical protein